MASDQLAEGGVASAPYSEGMSAVSHALASAPNSRLRAVALLSSTPASGDQRHHSAGETGGDAIPGEMQQEIHSDSHANKRKRDVVEESTACALETDTRQEKLQRVDTATPITTTTTTTEAPIEQELPTSDAHDEGEGSRAAGGEFGESGWVETVDPWIDPVILELLLDKQQSLLSSASEMTDAFWEAVAATLNDLSGGSVVNGESVQSRVQWLLQVFDNPAHGEHKNLTDAMTQRLALHKAFMAPPQTVETKQVEDDLVMEEEEHDEPLCFGELNEPEEEEHDEPFGKEHHQPAQEEEFDEPLGSKSPQQECVEEAIVEENQDKDSAQQAADPATVTVASDLVAVEEEEEVEPIGGNIRPATEEASFTGGAEKDHDLLTPSNGPIEKSTSGSPFRSKDGHKSVVVPDVDEMIMRLLLQKLHQVPSQTSLSLDKWMEITTALNEKHGLALKNGRAVRTRVVWLLQVLRERFHSEHGKLTPFLIEKLIAYNEIRISRRNTVANRTAEREEDEEEYVQAEPSSGSEDSSSEEEPEEEEEEEEEAAEEEDDEEDDGDGDEDEEEEDEGMYHEAKASNGHLKKKDHSALPSSSTVHQKASVCPEEDEKVMRLLLDAAPQLATNTKRMKVWHAIADAFPSSRFKSGNAVQQRVVWLLRVHREISHSEHDKLTSALRDMLTTCADLSLQRATYATKASKADAEPAAAPAPAPAPPRPKKQPPQPVSHTKGNGSRARFDPGTDNCQPFRFHEDVTIDPVVEEKTMLLVLDRAPLFALAPNKMDIWDEIARDSRGRFSSGPTARNYVGWLCRVQLDTSHRQHHKITDKLRRMLRQYRQIHPPKKQPRQRLSSAPPQGHKRTKSSSRAAADEDEDDAVVGKVAASRGQIHPASDELLARHVMEKRPFLAPKNRKGEIWDTIAEEMTGATNATNDKIKTGANATARFTYLLRCFTTHGHSKRKNLTKPLRTMLREYIALKAVFTERQLNKFLAVPTEAIEYDNCEVEVEDEASWADTVLLCEALRARPFHARPGKRLDLWEIVVNEVQDNLGIQSPAAQLLSTSQSCRSRVTKLTGVMANRIQDHEVHLTRKQRVILTLLNVLMKIAWPVKPEELTDKHQQCLAKIDKVVRVTLARSNTKKSHRETNQKKHKTMHSPSPQPSPLKREKRTEPTGGAAAASRHLSRLPPIAGASTATVQQVEALQVEMIKLQAKAIRDREEVKTLKDQMDSQTKKLISKMEKERESHRSQVATFVEMLRQDRETHHQETATLLDALEKEREARKQEFKTMMKSLVVVRQDGAGGGGAAGGRGRGGRGGGGTERRRSDAAAAAATADVAVEEDVEKKGCVCTICSKTFVSQEYLNKHVLRRH